MLVDRVHWPLRYCEAEQAEEVVQGVQAVLIVPLHVPERKDPALQEVVQLEHWRLEVAVQGAVSYCPDRQAVQARHCRLVVSEQVPLR